ncbi:DUF1831 domain-containing protein [Levilactobacillus acidifarinae]|uniref:Cysteine desulfurase n=1 Tax=Levilactobacillus acidifarinae DSM 19394 = JCM 15949 TaxID=1423715 RepID=A0A0R1LGF8_9LACO|nr:DUF1831 domain-containing protein [Levilactobacillus acidifarinae]KRK94813.1 hypothetical protein FD25_GL000789 [Levilactobacillus acidifarinae DSM 19394]GEO68572.1 cysteine desulfurase [Levilactobacillus acidifarinae]
MLFEKQMQIDGDTDVYELDPNIKAYALKDVGFQVSNAGNYTLERSVDPTSPYNRNQMLKITIAKDLSGFKMATTNASGNRRLNIFKGPHAEGNVEQYHFIMQNLIDREILRKQ